MNRVILQPTGNADAKKHYVDTLVNPVDLVRIKPFVSQEMYDFLKNLYPNGLIPTWGVTAGVKGVNKNKWDKIQPGDIAFFSANKVLYSFGTVTYKIHNYALAEHLWGFNSKGDTWEYIYFLDEIREHDLQVKLFNKIVDYSSNYNIQGFTVLDDEKSNKVISYFDLQSYFVTQHNEDEYVNIIKHLDIDALDIESKTKTRVEQGYLRKILFGKGVIGKCGICDKEFPTSFLIASHIKKRAFCSKEEKLDVNNIVMPMCRFGCDDLYEKGYIKVVNGVIEINNKATTKHLNDYLAGIEGNEIIYWNKDTRKYFEWHCKYHSLSKVR